MDNLGDSLQYLAEIRLIDNHCHSVSGVVLSRPEFEDFLTEAPSRRAAITSTFDSAAGLSLLAECSKVLGFDQTPEPDEYISKRASFGAEELMRLMFAGSGVDSLLVDGGYDSGSLIDNERLAKVSGARVFKVVRLEALAEQILASTRDAKTFPDDFRDALVQATSDAVALKSIAAYRFGLDLTERIPSRDEVVKAASEVVQQLTLNGTGRIQDRVLSSFLAYCAIESTRLPIQFHVGYGDPDLQLDRCNPSLLTPFIRQALRAEVNVVLLHCYPYQREAAYLAHSFENVYFDLGLTMNFVGYNSSRILLEALELAPFSKLLYSSDAFGVAELHYLGALHFRRAVGEFLGLLSKEQLCSPQYMKRLVSMFARENARRAYSL